MYKFLREIQNKRIHIVGVTGAEGSNILRFLVKNGIRNITAHDLLLENSLEKSFKLWHKGLAVEERDANFEQFEKDLSKTVFYAKDKYLHDIQTAEIIFVPQSWRLYKGHNAPLWTAKKKNIPFYSLTRLYLDLAPAEIIAVTGTVGKGSVANIIYQILKLTGRKVYFAGNETWKSQVLDQFDRMTDKDMLILEVSHRQLQDGISRGPHIGVITNLYPNHLDEVTWDEYLKLKISLFEKQKAEDYAVLNWDIPQLREIGASLKSKVNYFSTKNKVMNIKSIQEYFSRLMNIKSDQYKSNILASSTVLSIIGIDLPTIINNFPKVRPLTARLEFLGEKSGIGFYDDLKSTTPWATEEAVAKLGKNTILILGGKTKGINYRDFIAKIFEITKEVILLDSQLSKLFQRYLPEQQLTVFKDLKSAIEFSYQKAKIGDNILLSPSAGFFYTDFIKGKKSLRKLFISLLPKEQG